MVTIDESPRAEGQPLFVEFVNTLHRYAGAPVELIGGESEFAAWLLEHGLTAIHVEGRLPEVHSLRQHVRGMTDALASRRALPERDMDAIQAALAVPTGGLRLSSLIPLSLS